MFGKAEETMEVNAGLHDALPRSLSVWTAYHSQLYITWEWPNVWACTRKVASDSIKCGHAEQPDDIIT
jgi:hypothetical protein